MTKIMHMSRRYIKGGKILLTKFYQALNTTQRTSTRVRSGKNADMEALTQIVFILLAFPHFLEGWNVRSDLRFCGNECKGEYFSQGEGGYRGECFYLP